ncbi:hypothetical protein CSC25_2814 [Klebsiella pneumoniae]|nr:hypothetical protein CSC25_2814 [Klebsiella pneumoniae]
MIAVILIFAIAMLKYSTSSPASFILYIFSVADLNVRPSQRALNSKGVVLSNSF